jgi:hypothetical protein
MSGFAKNMGLFISASRAAFGATMIAAPQFIGEKWIGEPGRYERVALLSRSVGARDFALGAGAAAMLAQGNTEAGRILLTGQAISDAADFAGTLAVRERLPESGARWTLALAGASAIAAGLAAALLGD